MRKSILCMGILLFMLWSASGFAGKNTFGYEDGDIGPYPENYKDLIKAHFNKILFDPYSAVITLTNKPASCLAKFQKPGWFSDLVDGWVVCGTINAKNRFGGYAGTEPFYALILHGKVVHIEWDPMWVEDTCKQPFCIKDWQ